jgi:hypothetical protein
MSQKRDFSALPLPVRREEEMISTVGGKNKF